jgi:hypothetical protein
MQRNYKPPFAKFVKKQPPPLQLAIEDAVEDVCTNPKIGEMKTGDLQGMRVLKFTHRKQEYLIAYRPPNDEELLRERVDVGLLQIDFYQAGTHENFYSDLKKYLKS